MQGHESGRRHASAALVVCGLVALIPACSHSGDPAAGGERIGQRQLALGVPDNGFPSWQERTILMLTNRARADPDAELSCSQCPDKVCYGPVTPVIYNLSLAKAARFQSTNLVRAGSGLQHLSACALVADIGSLYPASCDGDPSCACEGGSADNCVCDKPNSDPLCDCPSGGCTAWNARIARFGVAGNAENIAAGNSDPINTFRQWIWEDCAGDGEGCDYNYQCCSNDCQSNQCVGDCGFSSSNGHRANILNGNLRRLGVGYEPDNSGCYSNYWTQDFAGGGDAIPAIPAGTHYPRSGDTSTTFTFSANYYDVGGAPTLARVVIDGVCQAMTLARGKDENGTLTYASQLATGCHRYYFYFKDASGALTTYPSAGSFGVQVGSGSCADYDVARLSPGAGCGCSGPADCDDNNVCTTDACNANVCTNSPISGCCTIASQCADGDVCTEDLCGGNQCSNATIAGCCIADTECGDGDVCTADSCTGNRCVNSAIVGCCVADGECDDGDICTADACSSNRCASAPIANCCTDVAECDDGDVCTTDSCTNDRCASAPIADCCTDVAQCDDGDVCTDDSCTSERCVNAAVPGCCNLDVDCDDGEVCTRDHCAANVCVADVVTGCCESAADCDDTNDCTDDVCADNACTNTPRAGCCSGDEDCADQNVCTIDHCDVASGTCGTERVPDCCATDTECDDQDPCTADRCELSDNSCRFEPISGCEPDAGLEPDGGVGEDGGAPGDGGAAAEAGADDDGGASAGGDGSDSRLSGGCMVGGSDLPLSAGLWLLLLAMLRRRRLRERFSPR